MGDTQYLFVEVNSVSNDDLTLKEAAQHFGVSVQTIRRWIKDGKLQAELRESPYGQQYYIPAYQIKTVAEIQDVVRVDHTADIASLTNVVERFMSEREQALLQALESVQNEIKESIQRSEQREKEMMKEIAATREENKNLHNELKERLEQRDKALMETLRALQERVQEEQKQKKKRWWQR